MFNFIKMILFGTTKNTKPTKAPLSREYISYKRAPKDSSPSLNYLKGKKVIQKSFVVFDIETTGLSSKQHEIIEIGAIRVNDIGSINHQTFHALIKPTCKLPRNIIKLTGITDAMLEECLGIETNLKEFKEFIGDLPVIAHNASFDCGFICEAFKKHDMEFTNHVIDTLALSRKAFPTLENHKLTTLKKHINIKADKDHRAMDDALSTLYVYTVAIKTLHGDVF